MSQNKITASLLTGGFLLVCLIFSIGYTLDQRELIFYLEFGFETVLSGIWFLGITAFIYFTTMPFVQYLIKDQKQQNDDIT